ncbi:hypothetical protein SAMN04487904_10356 [Actinopolyspora lacussalsi subsp. righensis]|uniref:Uncharacterized protein n=1 Tax=Actinopolyspora righensis TaxID=995060 RepID=A0A1I6YQ52_9ACTN|nr:hypothetical protein SAMN04487904_10356 [Actinopolyspora righensis]
MGVFSGGSRAVATTDHRVGAVHRSAVSLRVGARDLDSANDSPCSTAQSDRGSDPGVLLLIAKSKTCAPGLGESPNRR